MNEIVAIRRVGDDPWKGGKPCEAWTSWHLDGAVRKLSREEGAGSRARTGRTWVRCHLVRRGLWTRSTHACRIVTWRNAPDRRRDRHCQYLRARSFVDVSRPENAG